MKKIKLNCAATMEETFSDFLTTRRAKGLADKTLQSYEQQFRAVARHLDVKTDIAMLQKQLFQTTAVPLDDAIQPEVKIGVVVQLISASLKRTLRKHRKHTLFSFSVCSPVS